MEAIEMIKERRSVRKYKPQPVERHTVEEIIEAARWAPSWGNFQVARYTVVENPELIQAIAQRGVHGFAYNIGTLERSPNVVVLSYIKGKSGKLSPDNYATNKGQEWEMFDAGIACQTLCLAAHNYGVGTCIFGVIDDFAISQIIDLPDGETVAAVITMGYPDETPRTTPRHITAELTRFL